MEVISLCCAVDHYTSKHVGDLLWTQWRNVAGISKKCDKSLMEICDLKTLTFLKSVNKGKDVCWMWRRLVAFTGDKVGSLFIIEIQTKTSGSSKPWHMETKWQEKCMCTTLTCTDHNQCWKVKSAMATIGGNI